MSRGGQRRERWDRTANRRWTRLRQLSDAVWMTLASDRLMQVGVGFTAVCAALWVLPILPADLRQSVVGWVGPAALALLIPYALMKGDNTMGRVAEDAFWRDLVLAAWSALAAVVLRRIAAALDWDPALLLARLCLVITYTLVVVAVERQPHRQSVESRQTEIRLTLPTILLLVIGLVIYFVLLPARDSAPESPFVDLSHMSQIFTALGIVLVARVVYLATAADSPRWRALYSVLGLLAASIVLLHGRGLPAVVEWLGPMGRFASLLWLPPMLLAILLARIRHHPFAAEPRLDTDLVTRLGDYPASLALRTMFLALAVPVVHFSAYRLRLFDPAHEQSREIWVFFWILGLGGVAVFQNRLLSDRLTGAFRERRRIENALANTERSLRLADARRTSEEAVWSKKEKYVKAFRYSPDAMLLTTLEDGRLIEFNNRFLEILDYRREQVTGRTVFEIDLWANPDERTALTTNLQREGQVRDTEFWVRTRAGTERRVRVSAELMEVAGEKCLFTVARDVTAREESLSALQRQATLLEHAEEAIAVIDRDDVVTFANVAASHLLEQPFESMRGRPITTILPGCDAEEVRSASRQTRDHGVWRGDLRCAASGDRGPSLDTIWLLVTDAEGDATAKLIFLR